MSNQTTFGASDNKTFEELVLEELLKIWMKFHNNQDITIYDNYDIQTFRLIFGYAIEQIIKDAIEAIINNNPFLESKDIINKSKSKPYNLTCQLLQRELF